jgi:hypothetical protein
MIRLLLLSPSGGHQQIEVKSLELGSSRSLTEVPRRSFGLHVSPVPVHRGLAFDSILPYPELIQSRASVA